MEMIVHPCADLFPMLAEEDLKELADDLAAHGRRAPLGVDGEGRLSDGRHRLEAGKRRGSVSQFVALNGDAAIDYLVSANLARRQLTRGQRAMLAVALRRAVAAVARAEARP